jgi:hypothetical protein
MVDTKSSTQTRSYLSGIVKISVHSEFRAEYENREEEYKLWTTIRTFGFERVSWTSRSRYVPDLYDTSVPKVVKGKIDIVWDWFINNFYYRFK